MAGQTVVPAQTVVHADKVVIEAGGDSRGITTASGSKAQASSGSNYQDKASSAANSASNAAGNAADKASNAASNAANNASNAANNAANGASDMAHRAYNEANRAYNDASNVVDSTLQKAADTVGIQRKGNRGIPTSRLALYVVMSPVLVPVVAGQVALNTTKKVYTSARSTVDEATDVIIGTSTNVARSVADVIDQLVGQVAEKAQDAKEQAKGQIAEGQERAAPYVDEAAEKAKQTGKGKWKSITVMSC